ncbi:Galactose/methyl galactoside import ATP-binding protein MglA [Starkeya nomas]|uniref:Galactose/methyl galactoside import ATP-binding protein MglA n=1 Tax=Starkeya nomas TaxID=2666134 RepID=A0A5S9PA07_9HYPH|nr:sugar ABC transporter ATP-binding protein [Starkeya nomas]CAA0100447.1 Galactose/methyl galactoside import ATP-binding protein MglA [Starkeya nomas]
MDSETAAPPRLRLENIVKSFGPVRALKNAQFDLRPGEIHALAGENGAGKSTLMNIVDGILQPDSGRIFVDGEEVTIASPAAAQALGIGLVHQEIALCPDLSIAENLFMSATATSGRLLMDFGTLRRRAQEVMDRLQPIPVDTRVGDLSISEQQLVEIAKALTLDCRVLIFDEPTAALTEPEAQRLFAILRDLRARGMSLVYISHRMAEIFALCDRITVMRDGNHVSTDPIAALSPETVVNRLVGRELSRLFPHKAQDLSQKPPVLSVRGLSDGRRFEDVSFELRHGEILGFAGLIGAGRTEIAEAVCALRPRTHGDIALNGVPLTQQSYAGSIRSGVVYLSEDRKASGVFVDLPIAQNVTALRPSLVSRFGLIDQARERSFADALGRKVGLKRGRITDPVSSLSGGNQQKVGIAKMLSVNPSVIFLDEPTRGVDVGAKAEIYDILRELASAGTGIAVISSELPELIGLCDRILVVHEGRIAGEVADGPLMTEEHIIALASGLQPPASAAA